MTTQGMLRIVGSGIKMSAHLTVEAQAWIQQADRLFYLIPSPLAAEWMHSLNPQATDLAGFYGRNKPRQETYAEMVHCILESVRDGLKVCAVFYGHPGVFVLPAHEAIHQARKEGFSAEMLPGISAEDCLFSDLGFDPGQNGCQSYEATDFLIRPRRFDTSTALILWQIGVIGNLCQPEAEKTAPGLQFLTEILETHYDPQHEVVVYEAAQYPGFPPSIQKVHLHNLPDAHVTPISTLYVPPQAQPPVDVSHMKKLGLTLDMLRSRFQ